MLGEFKHDRHVFVHLFRRKIRFDINGSTEFLSPQMCTSLANLFQTSCGNVMQEGKLQFWGLNCSFPPKSKHFKS